MGCSYFFLVIPFSVNHSTEEEQFLFKNENETGDLPLDSLLI